MHNVLDNWFGLILFDFFIFSTPLKRMSIFLLFAFCISPISHASARQVSENQIHLKMDMNNASFRIY